MLTPAGQLLSRGIIRIHQTAAEQIHHILLLLSEAIPHTQLPPPDQAAPHTADPEVIQFLHEAPEAVQCHPDLTAVAGPPPLPHTAAADQYQEAVAGLTLQVVPHQEVLHQEVLHQAAAVAGEISSRQIKNITI